MTDEGENGFTKVSFGASGKVDVFLDLICVVKRPILYYSMKSFHERVKRISAIHLFLARKLRHKRYVICSQYLQFVNYVSRLLISHFELIDLERFPSVHFFWLWFRLLGSYAHPRGI